MRRTRPLSLHKFTVTFDRLGAKGHPDPLSFESLPLPDAVARPLYVYIDGLVRWRNYKLAIDLSNGSGVIDGGKLGSFSIVDEGEAA